METDRTRQFPPGLEREFRSIPRAAAARLEWYPGAGGTPLGVVAYRVRDPALRHGTVVYLNGTQSHAGWFEQAAVSLATRGFDVLCLDRRGSGINRRQAGVYSGHVDRYEDLVTDVSRLIEDLASRDTSVFVAAVSWGGKLALAHAIAHPDTIEGLVLITPALVVPRPPPIGMLLQVYFYSMIDETRPLPFRAPAAAFTRQPALIDYIEKDPLRLDVLSARFLMENARLQRDITRGLGKLRVPVQLFLATGDRIIDTDGVESLMRQRLAERLSVVRYADLGHVLALEDPGRFARDAASWMRLQDMSGEKSSISSVLARG